MGLDMYLLRFPRIGKMSPEEIDTVESWISWDSNPKTKKEYTFQKYTGKEAPDMNAVALLRPYWHCHYSDWDKNKEHPWWSISEEVGYWRKANQIHNWFVNNVQGGVDDCRYHKEITKGMLSDLLDVCQEVIDASDLIPADVYVGSKCENGVWETMTEDGFVVEDPSVAMDLLPTESGCFFGSTDYDQFYIDDLKRTIEICQRVLKETDFKKQMVYYISSW